MALYKKFAFAVVRYIDSCKNPREAVDRLNLSSDSNLEFLSKFIRDGE